MDDQRSADRTRAEFDPFIGALEDQVVYLGYDLNPTAVASLAEDAKKLNAQADVLLTKIDEVTRITAFIRSKGASISRRPRRSRRRAGGIYRSQDAFAV